jgi:hypothetical protein
MTTAVGVQSLIFSYNMYDLGAQAVLKHIEDNHLSITLSPVRGFGKPELRISEGVWYVGSFEILEFLKKEQKEGRL